MRRKDRIGLDNDGDKQPQDADHPDDPLENLTPAVQILLSSKREFATWQTKFCQVANYKKRFPLRPLAILSRWAKGNPVGAGPFDCAQGEFSLGAPAPSIRQMRLEAALPIVATPPPGTEVLRERAVSASPARHPEPLGEGQSRRCGIFCCYNAEVALKMSDGTVKLFQSRRCGICTGRACAQHTADAA